MTGPVSDSGYWPIHLDSGTFWLAPDNEPALIAYFVNGLIASDHGSAQLATGIASGWVLVRVDQLSDRPASLDESFEWQWIAEASVLARATSLTVFSFGFITPESLTNVVTTQPGEWLRLRASVHGRDIEDDGVAFEPVERYLIQVWPGLVDEGETILRRSDRVGEGVVRGAERRIAAGRPRLL